MCNFPRPGALLEHGEVVTFFHEFGHLLHHLLGGRTRWAGISGVRTEWDFVEAPSQNAGGMVLGSFGAGRVRRHHQSGAPIPPELVARMRAADEFRQGPPRAPADVLRGGQPRLPRPGPRSLDTTALAARLQEALTPFRYVPRDLLPRILRPLEGYSAIYYTYMWSLVIAKDLFGAFRREGLMNAATALRYRKAVLEPGGGAKAADLVRDFPRARIRLPRLRRVAQRGLKGCAPGGGFGSQTEARNRTAPEWAGESPAVAVHWGQAEQGGDGERQPLRPARNRVDAQGRGEEERDRPSRARPGGRGASTSPAPRPGCSRFLGT